MEQIKSVATLRSFTGKWHTLVAPWQSCGSWPVEPPRVYLHESDGTAGREEPASGLWTDANRTPKPIPEGNPRSGRLRVSPLGSATMESFQCRTRRALTSPA